jgi:hypothetical protein
MAQKKSIKNISSLSFFSDKNIVFLFLMPQRISYTFYTVGFYTVNFYTGQFLYSQNLYGRILYGQNLYSSKFIQYKHNLTYLPNLPKLT